MSLIEKIKNFNLEEATVTLWTFKKSYQKDAPPKFNGHWVDTSEEMDKELKNIITQELSKITEETPYSLLAENNEASVLTITEAETYAGLIKEQFSSELPNKKVKNIKTLFNCVFYVIKLVHDDKVLYAVKKTDPSWRSKTVKNVVSALFNDDQLELAEDNSFRIQKSIDFYGFGEELAVRNKPHFESILNYKAAHEKDYAEMSIEDNFTNIFDDLKPLTAFIGNNKIHLRRMSAIRQKGFYSDPIFMENLRKDHKKYGLEINFDSNGCIIPCENTCRDIIAALLDHRLGSGFSGNIYDVPDAVKV